MYPTGRFTEVPSFFKFCNSRVISQQRMARKKKGSKAVGAGTGGEGACVVVPQRKSGSTLQTGCRAPSKPSKQELKKAFQLQRGKSKSSNGQANNAGSSASPSPSETLPADERAFLEGCVTLKAPTVGGDGGQRTYNLKGGSGGWNGSNNNSGKGGGKGEKAEEAALVGEAAGMLERFHMCVVQNVLSTNDLDVIMNEFHGMLDFKGDSAIGEKDATKRSASRM